MLVQMIRDLSRIFPCGLLLSISVVNLPSVVCVNYYDDQHPMIYGINDPILPNAQPEQIIVTFEFFNILAIRQTLDCCDNVLFLIVRQTVNEFFLPSF